MLTKVELPKGYKRLINKEKERKDVIQIIDDEGFLREISFDDLTSHPNTLAGYGITDAYISNGTIYLGNQSITPAAVSSLGTAAYKDYTTTVTQGGTDLPTSDAVFQAIGAAVSSALHYRGISSTIITDGGTETAVIGGQPLVVQSGDVVIYSGFEFLWENNVWNKLGDDTSFALKTVQITGDGIYITGGGDLTTSRSLGLSQAAIDALTLASTALQSVAFSDLTSHPITISGYGITDANISNGTITLGSNSITPLTSFTETDPTVPSWAKASTKPSYGLNEITGTDDLRAIEALSGTGLAKRTADNTWELTDTADKAEELVTSTEDDAMFTSRQVPSVAVGDVCKVTSVKGKSIVWNQLAQYLNPSSASLRGLTSNFSGGIITLNGVVSSAGQVTFYRLTHAGHGRKYSHKILMRMREISGTCPSTFNILDGYATSTSKITPTSPVAIYTTPTSGSWDIRIASLAINDAFTDYKFWFEFIDLTAAGLDDLTTAEFETLYPDYHSYNAGELVNNAASGVEMLDTGGNSLGTIPLNITGLTSGGVQIFPDGMKSAGSVADEWSGTTATKRIGVVDLGTLGWRKQSSGTGTVGGSKPFFFASLINKGNNAQALSDKYITCDWITFSNGQDKAINTFWAIGGSYVNVRDSSYTTAADFKAAMSGVLLYYELKEPETYTVDALPDMLVPFDAQGTQRRLPVDTSEDVAAPMVCDFLYGANIGDVIKSINNNTEEYRKKSDNNFTNIETDEIHCTGDIEANGNLTINDVIAAAINASGEMSIPTQMPSTIELGRVFMYYDEAEHQLCIRESDGTIKTIQFT